MARWRLHHLQRRAAESAFHAQEVGLAARARCEELAQLRLVMRHRRSTIEPQLQDVRLRLARARSRSRAACAGPVDPAPVEAARLLADIPVDLLWIDYVGVGGMAALEHFRRMLTGARPMSRVEHDMIACALNERFAEAGFGQPVAYLGDGSA
jgi:hypothetical protein